MNVKNTKPDEGFFPTGVLFVCHGNICRSTMAESVLTDLVNRRGLLEKFRISSAATHPLLKIKRITHTAICVVSPV